MSKRPHPHKRETVSIDFDGVLHAKSKAGKKGAGLGEVCTDLIRQAHDRGYAVTIMTARELPAVAEALQEAGLRARVHYPWIRYSGLPWRWYGGRDGKAVLVTHRKVAATAYIDDRAVPYRFGQDTASAWAAVQELAMSRRQNA